MAETRMSKPDIITREIIVSNTNGLIHGYREHSSDDGASWSKSPWDHFYRNDPLHPDHAGKYWFTKRPLAIIQQDIGVETTPERARNFADAIDGRGDMWYYLAIATDPRAGDEALKWMLGALAAEIKIRKLAFHQMSDIMSGVMLKLFTLALLDGRIDRTFSKQIFAELMSAAPCWGTEAQEALLTKVIDDPRFKAVDDGDLVGVVEQIIADNPDQFKKACENPKLVQWFIGMAMKATQGKASAPKIIEIVTAKISALA